MVVLALKVFSRSTMRHAVLMMLAAGTMIVVINASGLSATLGTNTRDRIDFATAADMRISGIDSFKTSNNPVVKQIEGTWIGSPTRPGQPEPKPQLASPRASSSFTLDFGAPSANSAELSSFRSDFAASILCHELMAGIDRFFTDWIACRCLIDTCRNTGGGEAAARSGKGRIDIWSRLRDAEGTTHTIRLIN